MYGRYHEIHFSEMNSPSNSSGSHGSNALLISPSQVRSKTESAEDFEDFEEIELRLESRFSSRSEALVAINKNVQKVSIISKLETKRSRDQRTFTFQT